LRTTIRAALAALLLLAPAIPAWAANETEDDEEPLALVMPDLPQAPPPAAVIPPAQTGPAATIVLAGAPPAGAVACADRNVVIEASDGDFTLRGGCRSLTVQGHADHVQAELRPGAHVAIGGDRVAVRYTLAPAGGAAPQISIIGAGSTVLPLR